MTKMLNPIERTKLDMAIARDAVSFDVAAVRNFLWNGAEEWKRHSGIIDVLRHDPVFDKSQRLFMTRSEQYQRALKITNHVDELKVQGALSSEDARLAFEFLDEQIPIFLHLSAFEPVFNLQGSPELISQFSDLIATRGILGCYLQTELGHGTAVSSLETTATYIPETQEFDIHSPTVTSSKWWIGELGKTATHGVLQARLILPGEVDVGPHLFFLQLRSLETHAVLPGIRIGDIGPKALGGFAPTDNGFATFDHVRIPREHMLSKFAQVTKEGKYVKPPHAKLSYGGMLYIRSNMIKGAGWLMAKAATVSIRYTTVRRQGTKDANGIERQVISYPSVHYRLLPILSRSYVFILLGRNLVNAFSTLATRLKTGDTSLLPEMHALTSGLKVLTSTAGVQDLEVARRAMGGHGYSAFSGLGRLYADYLPSVTYEGDNFVLDQQVVRAAVKSYKNLMTSNDPSVLSPSSNYLRLLLAPPHNPSVTSWNDPAVAIQYLEWRAALLVRERAVHHADPDASADQRVSKAVTEAFVAVQVGDIIASLPLAPKEGAAVGALFRLYLLTTLEAGLTDLLSFGAFSTGPLPGEDATRSLRMAVADLCRELLPHAIGLTDAFGFTDWELDSALGVYDGNVYEALFQAAQTDPLNRTEIPAGYEEHIRPMLERGRKLAAARISKL
ncbi:hypothetical protein PLICRDRAFT_420565 [Plicaturopsis crispa FD-325 SS-3]|nr:hypothetical protein PLICRDRAFT_420565 [Plicaturopsis crispa FD-325 SS-3]